VTGCGCLVVIAGIIALLVIFIRGSFDAGEPIEQSVALAVLALLAVERWRRERSSDELVGARRP
jgi:hypothetical protein